MIQCPTLFQLLFYKSVIGHLIAVTFSSKASSTNLHSGFPKNNKVISSILQNGLLGCVGNCENFVNCSGKSGHALCESGTKIESPPYQI